jgi:protein-tyrosine phosphatase
LLKLITKGIHTVSNRIRTQGIQTTALWAYARGKPKITGVPPLKYSRVTESIYVGPQHRINGKRALEHAGITHIINMRSEFDDELYGLTLGDVHSDNYCYLPTIDDDPISAEHIERGIAFISSAIESGGKVYIHCSAGVGRAPSMAAAFLISRGYSTAEAFGLIRQTRPFIKPTALQIGALKIFEREVRQSQTNS